jgi:hypothetical protein
MQQSELQYLPVPSENVIREITLHYTGIKFPVLAYKFPVPSQKFPVFLRRSAVALLRRALGTCPQLGQGCEDDIEVVFGARMQDMKLQPQHHRGGTSRKANGLASMRS